MIKFLCKSETEVNYIIKKYNYKFEHSEIKDIIEQLHQYENIFLIKKSKRLYYCYNFCEDCGCEECGGYSLGFLNANNIMREEKLKNLLD